jgi:CheY-like chemotaxis protein
LDFVSRPGAGSTFWFEVPFGTTGAADELDPASSASSSSSVSSGPVAVGTGEGPGPAKSAVVAHRPRILVADDAPVSQMVASLRLERLGYQVDVVSTGAEALAAVQEKRYQAILMDCRMSTMDGYEATRRIRSLEGPVGATPIIAMTASVMDGDREACLFAGMDDYLVKPLDGGQLAAALARVSPSLSVPSRD